MLRTFFTKESESIAGAALFIGAASFASRILGVLRERLLVGHFGVGADLDAYYAAFQAPNIMYNLLILGTLSVAFIPIFVRLAEDRLEEAYAFAHTVLTATGVVMGVLCAVIIVGARPLAQLVVPGFSDAAQAEVASLTRILAFSIFLFSLSNVFGSVLNARKRFVAVAVAPLLYNLAIIAAIFVAPDVRGVAWGAVCGALLHCVLQVVVAARCGFVPRLAWKVQSQGFRDFLKLFVPRIWGVDVSQMSVFLGTVIGSGLLVGSVALFNLATNIAMVPVAIFGYAFAIAAFPALNAARAKQDRDGFIQIFTDTARQIIFFLLPTSVLLILLRAHVVRLIIGTRQLSWDDTRLAAAAVALFAVSICLQGLAPLLSRAFYAMKNTWIPVLVSGGTIVVYISVAYAVLFLMTRDAAWSASFSRLLRLEGIGDVRMLALPLAYTVAAVVQVVALAVWLRTKFGSFGGRTMVVEAAKMVVATLVAGIATYGGLQAGAGLGEARTYLSVLEQFLFAGALGGMVYMMAAISLKIPEAEGFLQTIRRRMVKLSKPLGLGEGERL